MNTKIKIERDKAKSGLSYVLKTIDFERMINEGKIETSIHLIFRTPQIIGSIFEAYFWPSNQNFDNDRFYIRAGPVGEDKVILARKQLIEIVLPEFAKWAKEIIESPENST